MTTQIFDYEDENEVLADMILDLVKHGKTDTPYNLLEMGIYNAEEYYADRIAEMTNRKTFVEVSVTDLFQKKSNDKPVDFETFWTNEKTLAHRAPHWNRKVVTVRVYNTNNTSDKQYDLVKLNCWFGQKNKSYMDLCLGTMFFEPTKLRDGVHAEWAERLCDRVGDDEWIVDTNTFRTVLGGVAVLSKQLKAQDTARMKKLTTALAA